jgi:hypothetical protein
VLRLGPGGVVSAFDVPFGHLAFDDARYRALASGSVEPTDESVEEEQPSGAVAAVLSGGKGARVGESLSGDPQLGHEADLVRVVP